MFAKVLSEPFVVVVVSKDPAYDPEDQYRRLRERERVNTEENNLGTLRAVVAKALLSVLLFCDSEMVGAMSALSRVFRRKIRFASRVIIPLEFHALCFWSSERARFSYHLQKRFFHLGCGRFPGQTEGLHYRPDYPILCGQHGWGHRNRARSLTYKPCQFCASPMILVETRDLADGEWVTRIEVACSKRERKCVSFCFNEIYPPSRSVANDYECWKDYVVREGLYERYRVEQVEDFDPVEDDDLVLESFDVFCLTRYVPWKPWIPKVHALEEVQG